MKMKILWRILQQKRQNHAGREKASASPPKPINEENLNQRKIKIRKTPK